MATSGYKTIKVTDYDSLKFSWERTSYSIANNTSTISWKMQLISTGYGKIISTASKDWKVVVAGKTFSGTNTVGISANSTKTLASGTRTIEHNSDGSKTFSYSFSQEFAIDFNGYVGTKSGSGEGTLNTIPRASVLSVSNGTLGTAQTLKITEYSSGFTHKLKYECGTASGWIIGDSDTASSTLSKSWTPPLSLAKQDTTSSDCAVNVKFTLTTYNGSSKVGDSKTYTKTFKMPSSIKPTVPTITVSDTTNYKSTYGNYVQNKSKIKVVGSASGSYGSTIKSYTVTIDGNNVTHAKPFTSSYSGTRTIKVVATDSRGRTNSATKEITVLAYSKPSFASFSAVRDDLKDTELKVNYKINYSSINSKNTLTVEIYVDGTKKATSTKAQDSITISGVSNSTIENVYAKVTDKLNSTAESNHLTVLAPLRIISVHKTGEGVAIGKRAETEGFECAWTSRFYKNAYVEGNLHLAQNASYIYGKTTEDESVRLLRLNTNNNILVSDPTAGNATFVYGGGTKLVNIGSSNYSSDLQVYGKASGPSGFSTSSDKRVKKNIKNADIDIVDKLQSVEYQLASSDDDKTHYGFIAQDVVQVLLDAGIDPETCGIIDTIRNGEDEQYVLTYTEFIPLLTTKCQALQSEVDNLRKEITELKNLLK